jgi:dipeptidyl-peptidase-3
MKRYSILTASVFTLAFLIACNQNGSKTPDRDSNFEVSADSFADLQVLRYQVPGFEELTRGQKKLAYYLSEAALCGRDITYDQHNKYNLLLRKTLENIYGTYKGERNSADWEKFKTYAGRFWFSN